MNTTKTTATTKNSRKILKENYKNEGEKWEKINMKIQKIQHNRSLRRNWKTETKIKGNLDLRNKREHQISSKINKKPISYMCVRQSVKCARERKNTVTKTKEKKTQKKTWPKNSIFSQAVIHGWQQKGKTFSDLPCTIFVTLHECYTCPLFWHSRLK